MRPEIKSATPNSSMRCCRPRPTIDKSEKPAIGLKPPSSRCALHLKTSTLPLVAPSAKRKSKNFPTPTIDWSDRRRQDVYRPGDRSARLCMWQVSAVHDGHHLVGESGTRPFLRRVLALSRQTR